MNAEIYALIEALRDNLEHAMHLKVRILDADGEVLGEHYNVPVLVLALLDEQHQIDLANMDAGGSIPVEVAAFATFQTYVG